MEVDGISGAAPEPPDTFQVSRDELLFVLQGLHLLQAQVLAELNEYYRSDGAGEPLKQWRDEEVQKIATRLQQVSILSKRLSPF